MADLRWAARVSREVFGAFSLNCSEYIVNIDQ